MIHSFKGISRVIGRQAVSSEGFLVMLVVRLTAVIV